MTKPLPVNRDQLREWALKQPAADVLVLLDRALERLSESDLDAVLADYVHLDEFRAEAGPSLTLYEAVKAFHAASLRGAYYEGFNVNSRNFTMLSGGTQRWLAEFDRLLRRCVAAAPDSGCERQVRDAFELLFDLLSQIDECRDDIVFFADEGGSWQAGVNWPAVIPAWCRCLAATATPEEYAAAVVKVIDEFARHDRAKLLGSARQLATQPQRAA
ncbi:MAG: hypothetical protein ACOYOB_17960, partial [Myxococcota bacterium]